VRFEESVGYSAFVVSSILDSGVVNRFDACRVYHFFYIEFSLGFVLLREVFNPLVVPLLHRLSLQEADA